MTDLNRRTVVASLGLLAMSGLIVPAHAKPIPGGFVMWRSRECGCCLDWAKRVEASFGRSLAVVDADMAVIKRARGVPQDLQSCHTALIGGYVVEGHVPPADIKRLIASKSKSVRGLAVAGMPAGSPGMDIGHQQKQPYDVVAFGSGGRRSVFASYR